MSKNKYDIELPKGKEQLESLFANIFKKNPTKHYIIRVLKDYFELKELLEILQKYEAKIEKFRRNKSIIILTEDFDYEQIPEFIPQAPTEEEAVDIIDFEEIERDLF